MKIIPFATLALFIGILASRASPSSEGVRFAAMSLTNGQGLRAIISNVLAPANGNQLATCQVQVGFVGADGSPIGNTTTVQLKPGESTSVSATHPSKLVRAIVSIDDVVDLAKVCVLKTSVEIFDLQTGMTFVSVPGDSFGNNGASVVSAPSLSATRKKVPGRENSAPAVTSPSLSGTAASPKTRSPVLAASPPATPR